VQVRLRLGTWVPGSRMLSVGLLLFNKYPKRLELFVRIIKIAQVEN